MIEKNLFIFAILQLIFLYNYCIVFSIGMRISRCGLPPTKEEVRRMVEVCLLIILLKLLLAGLVSVTIITFTLIIAIVVIISKQK